MKDPWDWTEDDLLDLVRARAQESLTLEFKASAAIADMSPKQKSELSKDVSALANSAGGVVVYGISEDGHAAKEIDEGLDPAVVTKEWLDQVISSGVQRRIDGVRIKQIELTTRRPGRVAYVVSIPQSNRAPHQASDNRFYKRQNFQCLPMEEYEVRDVARREQTSDIRCRLEPTTGLGSASRPWVGLRVHARNEAQAPAPYALFQVLVDARLDVNIEDERSHSTWIKAASPDVMLGRRRHAMKAVSAAWVSPPCIPIFAGIEVEVGERLTVKLPGTDDATFVLGWRAVAPGADLSAFQLLHCYNDGKKVWLETKLRLQEHLARYDEMKHLLGFTDGLPSWES